MEVWEDVKLLFQVSRRPKLRDRAAVHRQALAAELDAIEAEWQAKAAARGAAS